MLKQRIFLVSVVYVIHCFVKPFLISFRIRSSSVLPNAGIFRLAPFYASDEDIKSLYEKAQVEDAEWFQRVLGDNAVIIPQVAPGKVQEKSGVPAQTSSDKPTRAVNSDEMKSLNFLGYSDDDITSMKKSIMLVIIESNVKRPRKGLPESWLEPLSASNVDQNARSFPDDKRGDNNSIRDGGGGGGKRVTGVETNSQRRDSTLSAGRRGERNGGSKENEQRRQEFAKDSSGNRDPFDLEEDTRSERGSRVGEAFAWNGSPLTDEEVNNGQRVRRGATNAASQGSSSSRGSSGRINKNDWDDANDEDSPSPFWPDVEEFKDMLLDESQWRSDLIGEWSVPLIRQETKWRYKLYKNWLTFLDEGLGDGFDVVDDEFREYYDDDGENDDDNNGMNNEDTNPYKNRDGSGDRGSGRDRSSSTSNEPFRDQSDTARDKDRDNDNTRNRPSVSQRKTNNENGVDNSMKSNRRVELSRAEKYDNWVGQRVGANGIWTNIAEEQWEATKEQRLAAERRRRREEDFDYDDRASENKQKPRRLNFDDFDDPVNEDKRDSRRFETREDGDERRFDGKDSRGNTNFGERRRERGDEIVREGRKGDGKEEMKRDRGEETVEGDSWKEEDRRRNLTQKENGITANDYINEDSFRAAWKSSAERSPVRDDKFYSPSPSSKNK